MGPTANRILGPVPWQPAAAMPSLEHTAAVAHEVLRTAEQYESGSHTLKGIATSSHELLQLMGKPGKKKPGGTKIMSAYAKTLKSLNELEKALIDEGVTPVPSAAATPRSTELQIVHTLPLVPLTAPPSPAAGVPPQHFIDRLWPQAARLRWLVLVYLPAVLIAGCSAVLFLAGFHMITNPETLLDLFTLMVASLPDTIWDYMQKLGRMAYHKLFWRTSPRYSAPIEPPAAPYVHAVPAETTAAPLLLVLVLLLGWWISAARPARPY